MLDNKKRDALLSSLISADPPKASIYLPTHRAFPENKQDPIQYKNLLQQLEATLTDLHPRREWQEMMEALRQVLDDDTFWNNTTEGLAVLAAGDRAETFLLESSENSRYYLGNSFHLLPLFPLMDSVGQAYLLDLSQDRFAIYLVSRDGIMPEELTGVQTRFSELFSDLDANANLRTGSYSGLSGAFHGHGGRAEETERDRTKYFHYLDDAFTSLHKESGLPMILAGTESTVAEYRQLAKSRFYLDGEIGKPLDSLDQQAILEEVRHILKPHMEKSMEGLRTLISNKINEKKAVSDLKDIASAAGEGRVEMLLLPGSLRESEQALLDRAVEQVLAQGGKVYADTENVLTLPVGRLALLRY